LYQKNGVAPDVAEWLQPAVEPVTLRSQNGTAYSPALAAEGARAAAMATTRSAIRAYEIERFSSTFSSKNEVEGPVVGRELPSRKNLSACLRDT
jgi:hypothetical protein